MPTIRLSAGLQQRAEGRYVFGANELFVFQALDEILKRVAARMADPTALYDAIARLDANDPETTP